MTLINDAQVYFRNRAHGWTRHNVTRENGERTLCGMSVNREELTVVWSEPNTLHSSLSVFDCDRCKAKNAARASY